MNAWRRFVVEHLNGNSNYSIEINSPEDWPVNYEIGEAEWKHFLGQLQTTQEQLLRNLDSVTDEQLDNMVPNKKFRWYVFLHGVLHHDIYHSAQVSLLKKFAASDIR